jgi:bifunctional phosphoserine phosphatase/homoserine phosphotransferase
VAEYRLRQPDQKRHAVNALKGLNYKVIAAGDSYNDTAMLGAADAGFLMHAPPNIVAEFPQFPLNNSYPELLAVDRRRVSAHRLSPAGPAPRTSARAAPPGACGGCS